MPVAKQVATLDRMLGGRRQFGVGVGGEFANEYAACGVPLRERGARLDEGIRLLRDCSAARASRTRRRFYPLQDVRRLPTPAQREPPIYGGRPQRRRARAHRQALRRLDLVRRDSEAVPGGAGEDRRRGGERAAQVARFHTGHLLFTLIRNSFEDALDGATEASRAATRWTSARPRNATALGKPADVAARIAELQRAGVRDVIVDVVGRPEEREEQLARFAAECGPLLGARA